MPGPGDFFLILLFVGATLALVLYLWRERRQFPPHDPELSPKRQFRRP